MIVYHIRELAEKAGLKTYYQLQMALGVPGGTAARWWKNPQLKHIESESLDLLCEFFDCEPGDIIKRVPNAPTRGGAKKSPSPRRS